MKRNISICSVLIGIAMISLFLSACSNGKNFETENPQEKLTILRLAAFEPNDDLLGQVELFNNTHQQYRIQVEQYQRSEISEEDGIAKLQREIMTGKGPDLIDFGSSYSTSDVAGAYTENLYPYLKQETENSGEVYFENVLESFSYDGQLYAMPTGFGLNTFAGSAMMLDDRSGWTIQELREVYENAPAGTILYPGETKKDVFGTLLFGNLDYYVDWESGTCRFDSEEFAEVLEFAGGFPDSLRITDDYSAKQIYDEDGALLYQMRIRKVYDICNGAAMFGEEVRYPGFPVEAGCGTVITATNHMLAISVNSEHKETAWKFIVGFLSDEYQEHMTHGLPISESALEDILQENREILYETDADGKEVPVVREEIRFEGEDAIPIYHITETEAEELLRMAESATLNSNVDSTLYGIVLEEADAYFVGDKTLEETCRVIQGRAQMYVAERRS